jgi:hypothetical protein
MRNNGAHLTGRIRQSHNNLSLGIILLLEIDKRSFDCIQLILSIEIKASLPDLEQVSNLIRKLSWSTYPYLTLGVRFENEFSHNSL